MAMNAEMERYELETSKKMKNLVNFFQTVRSALLSAKIEEDNFLRPKQLECLDHLIQKQDLIAILPTGYGKSILFQVLPWLGTSEENNIVIVVVPLTSIIRDQFSILQERGISVGILQANFRSERIEHLMGDDPKIDANDVIISPEITAGDIKFLFTHPEALLSANGRELMASEVYQKNVSSLVIDEAHCVTSW